MSVANRPEGPAATTRGRTAVWSRAAYRVPVWRADAV